MKPEKDSKLSIVDVAEMLGVSPSTVSRAINGKKGVSEKQREKILNLVREIGYQPNSLMQGMTYSTAGTLPIIGMILGDIRNPFYSDLVFNIQKILNESGYLVMVLNSEYEASREVEMIHLAQELHFAGLILVTAQSSDMEECLSGIRLPKVLVNRILPSYHGDSVLSDNFQAGYIAAMHLIDLNHTHIGFICGPKVSSASSQRFEGYKQALNNFGLTMDEHFVYESDLKIESGKKIAEHFLRQENRPTAIIAVNDMTAIGFMDQCRKQHVSIPDDISIVSFDNILFTSVEGINLTSISHRSEEMGEQAVRLLLKQLQGDTTHPERVILTPELIIRNSTKQRVS